MTPTSSDRGERRMKLEITDKEQKLLRELAEEEQKRTIQVEVDACH